MVSSRLSAKQSLLLSTFTLLSVFSATGLAQGNGGNGGTTTAATNTPAQTNTRSTQQQTTRVQTSITNTGRVQTTQTNTVPVITGTNTLTDGGALTGLPKLSNTPVFISYPPPTVPPTANAPFMQRSSLPDGTVFIAVGAILGAFGAAVVIWRGIVACLLHRSVERAATAQHVANDKATFPAPPAPFYKYTDRESSPSLGIPARGVRRTNRGPTPSATPSQTNLFFSPTAAGGSSMGGNRDSRFLPSGFYAAGSPSPAMGHGHSISLTNLRPESRGYPAAGSRSTMREPSPPDSPNFGATTRRDMSSSSLNLNRPPSGRAPSAYLEDLLDENPNAFPPQAREMPPSVGVRHAHTFSHSSQGRY
jgi:hypothetical protein